MAAVGTVVGNAGTSEFTFILKHFQPRVGDIVALTMEVPARHHLSKAPRRHPSPWLTLAWEWAWMCVGYDACNAKRVLVLKNQRHRCPRHTRGTCTCSRRLESAHGVGMRAARTLQARDRQLLDGCEAFVTNG